MSGAISRLLPAAFLLLALPLSVACHGTGLCSGDGCEPPASSSNEAVHCSGDACGGAATEVPDGRPPADETRAPEALDAGPQDAAAIDAAVVRRCLEDLSICPDDAPYCYPAGGGVCVECLVANDCVERNPKLPHCRNDVPDVDLEPSQQRCVECLTDEHCRPLTGDEERYCVENVCSPCKPGSCAEDLVCVQVGESPAQSQCLECGKDTDCRREGYSGVCEEHRCVPCASGERLPHRGCEALTPVCSESSSLDENHCVVCLEDSHCPAEAPHCTDSGCVACRAGGTDCGPESPVCAESSCSACSNHEDCARFEETPVCDSASGSCAECLTDEHCTLTGASRCVENQCVPCDVDADCAHLPSQHLCHEGLCVECYGKETSACETNRVCNMIAGSEAPYSCTHFRAGEANFCEPCVSDAHCRAGAHCVLTQFQGQDTGYFCLLREGGDAEDSPADCRTAQLYTNAQELTSTDGRTGRYCAPTEEATCPALHDYGKPCEADEDCGMPGLDDGLCVPYVDEYRCSYGCSHVGQCPGAAECNLNENYCRL